MFFCCCPPRPSPTPPKKNPRMGVELADISSLIIRLQESQGPRDPPESPRGRGRDSDVQVILPECRPGQVGERGRPCAVIPVPLSVCWQTSDSNSGSCAVFCLATVAIFTERTSLLIKLCLLSGSVLFTFLFGLPVHGGNSVSLLTRERHTTARRISLFFEESRVYFFERQLLNVKKKKKNPS